MVQYLGDHGVAVPSPVVTPRQLRSLSIVRDTVRGLADPAVDWTPGVRAILSEARFRLDVDANLVAPGSGWDGFIHDLMLPLLQIVEMRDRLRICGNPMCRLMFLDLSKNRGRLWCDNAGCGNRDRVRRHRSRTKTEKRPTQERAGASAAGNPQMPE